MSDAPQVTWDAAPEAPPPEIKWDEKESEASLVANRPNKTAPVPLPYTDKRIEEITGAPSSPLAKPVPLGPYGIGMNSKSGVEDVADAYKSGGWKRAVHVGVVDASQAFAPLLIPAAAAAPLATAVSLGAGMVGQQAGKSSAEALGASEDTANLVGDAGALAGGYLGAKTPELTAAPRQALAEKIVSPVTYENLGETKADIRTGVNPERGLTREGMVGTKVGLAEKKIPARLTELKTAANDILQNHRNAGQIIDVSPLIDQAIDAAIGDAEKVAGDTGRLENLRTALKTKYGPMRGTPAQINDLKTEIQSAARGVGAYKNTQPVEASVAAAMGDAARRIRASVDQLVPEAAELNGRMSDLIDAQAGIRSKIAKERGQDAFGDVKQGIVGRALSRTVGSAPIRTGLARAVNVGNTLDVPQPLPPAPGPRGLLPAAPLFTPPPADTSGPVDLGPPSVLPLADNRLLPAAGRTTGPRSVSGPSQYGVSLPETTPRPLTGPERQLPEIASPSNTSLPMERGGRGPNQIPPPIELGPSSLGPQEGPTGFGNAGGSAKQVQLAEPETPQARPERRSPRNAERRRRMSEMSPEEMRKELSTSTVTDLPNRRAFDEAGDSPAVGISDVDGLKALNDKFGYDAGDALLKAKADALKEAGVDAYHDKGDEFLYRGDEPQALAAKLEKARELLRNQVIDVTRKDGSVISFRGADFSYGADTEISRAEEKLKSHKAQREARGERSRGELRGITEVGPQNR